MSRTRYFANIWRQGVEEQDIVFRKGLIQDNASFVARPLGSIRGLRGSGPHGFAERGECPEEVAAVAAQHGESTVRVL